MREPNSATPSTLPVCRVALRTPAAIPERDFFTLPSKVEVSGGTSKPSPPPMATSCAHSAQYLAHTEQRQATGRRDQSTAGGDGRRAEPLGEPRRQQIDRQHDAHHRHEREAGGESGPMIDLLEVQAEHEEQAVNGDIDQKSNQRRHREHPLREQRQRQHRLRRAPFLQQQQRGEHDESAKAGEDPWIGPADTAAFDDRARQNAEHADRRGLSRQIEHMTGA